MLDFELKHNVQIGLKENWKQFTILVIVNAFVGGMIGIERSILPQFASIEFGVASKTAILTFITAFGISKAIANYFLEGLQINLEEEIFYYSGGCLLFQFHSYLFMLQVGVG